MYRIIPLQRWRRGPTLWGIKEARCSHRKGGDWGVLQLKALGFNGGSLRVSPPKEARDQILTPHQTALKGNSLGQEGEAATLADGGTFLGERLPWEPFATDTPYPRKDEFLVFRLWVSCGSSLPPTHLGLGR